MKKLHSKTPTSPFVPNVLSLAVATLVLTGCASSGNTAKVAATPNPFAITGSTGTDQVKVNTLRVFGDSYTDPAFTNSIKTLNWASALKGSGYTSEVENYAKGGARTSFSQTISFDKQIAAWKSKNSGIAERDLTITYLGYNDIGRSGRSAGFVAASKAGYVEGINQLVAAGAASGTNRIFVTQIHDWSRNPGVNTGLTKDQVVDWNNHVAAIANGNLNILAVDLYTTFNRILNDPAKYGFSNVTSVDPSRHAVDALFYDSIHFGSRGQEIIARTYAHYLTRAWNWANALEAGSASAAQLNQDIDQGLLVLGMQQQGQKILGSAFSLVPLGLQAQASQDRNVQRPSFNHYISGQKAPAFSGVALNFNGADAGWGGASQVGLALHQKQGSTPVGSAERQTRMGMQSHAASVYWVKPLSDFLLTTQVSQSSQRFSQSAADDLVLRSVDNSRKGSNWSMESKLRYSINQPAFTLTPWASLTQTRQRLDAGTLQTLYTSDVTFSATQSKEWVSGLGVDLQFTPVRLSGGRQLQWGGSLMHRESISRDAFVVSMREAAQPLAVQRELIDRARINQTYLGLNAQLDLSKHWNLSASYAADLKQTRQTQAVQVRASAHF